MACSEIAADCTLAKKTGTRLVAKCHLKLLHNLPSQMWSVNCKANLHLFRKALPTLNANEEGGVFLVTASIAGISPRGSSLPYSVTKAAGKEFSADHGAKY